MSFEEVRNTLVIALAEGSISEEEFPILYEEYESVNPLYPHWEFDAFCFSGECKSGVRKRRHSSCSRSLTSSRKI